MWVCAETGSAIRDDGDGGSCGRHFHPRRAHADGFAAAVWRGLTVPEPVAANGPPPAPERTADGFSILYSPFKRGIENRESFSSSGMARPDDFSILSYEQLRSMVDPPQSWSVDGLLLADGTSYVGSKPKVGKTCTAINLASSVALGTPFLGRRVAAGTVVLLALEERRAKLKASLGALLGDAAPELAERVLVHVGAAPKDPYGALARLIDRHHPSLVIVDTVAKLCRFSDINDYSEVVGKLEPLSELARSARCHIAMLGHLGKSERADGTDEVLGSTALTAAVDTIVLLKRTTEGARTIATIQRDGEDLPESMLEYDATSGRCWLGGSKGDQRRLEIRAELVGLLGSDGMLSEIQVRELTAHNVNDISRALRELVAEGTVVRYGSGRRGDPYRYGLRAAAPSPEEEES